MHSRSLAIIVLLALVTVAVFGFLAMAHGTEHGAGCLAATASGAMCPSTEDPIADVAFHVGTWRSLTAGTIVSALLFLLPMVVIAFVLERWRRFLHPISIALAFPQRRSPFRGRISSAVLRWLALHERRDPPSPCYA